MCRRVFRHKYPRESAAAWQMEMEETCTRRVAMGLLCIVCAVAVCGAPKVRSTYFNVGCVWLVGKSPHVCALSLVCSLITLSVVQSQNYARFVFVRVYSWHLYLNRYDYVDHFSVYTCAYVICVSAWREYKSTERIRSQSNRARCFVTSGQS